MLVKSLARIPTPHHDQAPIRNRVASCAKGAAYGNLIR